MTLHAGTEQMTPPSEEMRAMTSLKATAVVEQIDIRTKPEPEPPVHKTAPPEREGQANPIVSSPMFSTIRLNTMPYPASGPGGPSLTSRKH